MPEFTSDLCEAVLHAQAGPAEERQILGRMVADTLAVAAAGFATPTLRRLLAALHSAGDHRSWNGQPVASAEDAAMINAAAAHSLDYDDLETISSAHINAVILATLCSGKTWPDEEVLLASLRAGILTAQTLGTMLGNGHYSQGWHATATIGALAATAAGARSMELAPAVLSDAFALAAAQAAGLQANFGTSAKAMQAGFAASAAIRSLHLACAGISGGKVFEQGGFFQLYRGGVGTLGPSLILDAKLDAVVPKLYPCCFATHHMIAATLEARNHLDPKHLLSPKRITVSAPSSSLAILRIDHPQTAVEAAFSARYCVAATIRDGAPMLRHFEDPLDPDLLARSRNISIQAVDDEWSTDLRRSFAELCIELDDGSVHRFRVDHLPGLTLDHDRHDVMRRKIADCLASDYEGGAVSYLTGQTRPMLDVARWFEPLHHDNPRSG